MRAITLLYTAVATAIGSVLLSNSNNVAMAAALNADANSVSAAATKEPLWEFRYPSAQAATNPIAHRDMTYVPTNTSIYALEAATGKLKWSFAYTVAGDYGGYATADDELVVVGTFKALYAISAHTGALVWTVNAPTGNIPAGYDGLRPRFGGGRGIYVTTGYTPLMKYDSKGKLLWTATAAGIAQLHATEARGLDLVYFITRIDGVSYAICLSAHDGSEKWRLQGAFTLLVSDDVGIVLLQGKATINDQTGGTFTAVHLLNGTQSYQLFFPKYGHIDDYFWGESLYTMTAPSVLPYYPTTYYRYDARHGGAAKWSVPNIDFLFFTSCKKGLISFGPQTIDAYDEASGNKQWTYKGAAVNAGAVTERGDVIISVLADKVVAFQW